MKLSVVIPCFNAGTFLAELLDSCINQTFKDWELIIVDDHSTDSITQELLIKYSQLDSRIKVFSRDREPKGGDTCRNIGMSIAQGKYLMILDADDIVSPTCFENRVSFLDNNPDCDYASFPAASFISGTDPFTRKNQKGIFGKHLGEKSYIYYLLQLQYPFTVWANIYRFDKVRNILWDEKVTVLQDFDWMVSCCLQNLKHKYSSTEECDYFYRSRADGQNVCADFSADYKCDSTIYLTRKTYHAITQTNDATLLKQFYKFSYLQVYRILLGEKKQNAIKFVDEASYLGSEFSKKMLYIIGHFTKKQTNHDALRLSTYFFLSVSPALFFCRFAYCIRDWLLGRGNNYYM